MKPFPEAVQKAFPCPSDRHPERPWWVRAGGIGTRWYQRAEPRAKNDWMVLAVHIVHPTESELPRIDAEQPLPHPGYRAGQIWVDKDGWGIVITSSLNSTIWTAIGTKWSPEEFERAYPYLVADPACPHVAPWSPVEAK